MGKLCRCWFLLVGLGLIAFARPPAAFEPPAWIEAIEVTRPGLVLVDVERRRAELAFAPDAFARLCRGQGVPRHAPRPFRRIEPPQGQGSDRRAEPLGLLVMQGAADHLAGGPDGAVALRALADWARAGALVEIAELGPQRSNTLALYSLRRVLLPLIAGWAVLSDHPQLGAADRQAIAAWLGRLVALAEGPTGGRASRARAQATSNRNNHAQLAASVEAAWGALEGDATRFRTGIAGFVRALAELDPEGGLPLEQARGPRALWYQRHALASLVTIAEIAALQGLDLYAVEVDGRSLHDAVAFLVRGIARARAGGGLVPVAGGAGAAQDLGFLERRGHGRHYMAWAEAYIARHPARAEARALALLLAEAGAGRGGEALVDDYSGANTSCLFRRPETRSAALAG